MTIDPKQPSVSEINTRPIAVEVVYHPSRVFKEALGSFKFDSGGMMMMFFKSQERGLGILKVAVRYGMILADDAPTIDHEIRTMDLPMKESDEVPCYEFSCRDGTRGSFLFLTENGKISAIASRLVSSEKMLRQIRHWVESYNIPAATSEVMKMKFCTSNRLPPSEMVQASLPFVIDNEE